MKYLTQILTIFLIPNMLFGELGDVLHTILAPDFHSTGLAWDGNHLWVGNIAEASLPISGFTME